MSLVIDAASALCLIAGAFFCVAGGLGMLRMPDFYTRAHATSVMETLGAGLILTGLALQAGLTLVTAKLAIIGLLIFLTSRTAAHALAKAALARGIQPLLGRRRE